MLAVVGSLVVVVTSAVLTMLLESGADALTWNTNENVASAPEVSVAIVQVIVPVPPTAGVVQLNVGPVVCVADTNVVLAEECRSARRRPHRTVRCS